MKNYIFKIKGLKTSLARRAVANPAAAAHLLAHLQQPSAFPPLVSAAAAG
ncbi:hypothetical protein [Klebsiella quasipneumoniae]|nr:hypothetical protein [Klebsiella quasipneumoniae]MCJ1848840.1 hypothetical protein [Klebsiella quasipneumoniae subsp. similipneumoniae]QLP56879.1 hypothetical protein HV092_04940 [Klebsiella quasipneumoniae]